MHCLHEFGSTETLKWLAHPCSQVIKDLLADYGVDRIHLERFPGCTPDLNPDEGIWNYLWQVELKNLCCRDLAQLRTKLRKATQRLRYKKHIVKACIRQPGYT